MIVNSPNVYSVNIGKKTYQVFDNEPKSPNKFHRFTVMEWNRTGFFAKSGGRLETCDGQIYAETEAKAFKIFCDKYKKK